MLGALAVVGWNSVLKTDSDSSATVAGARPPDIGERRAEGAAATVAFDATDWVIAVLPIFTAGEADAGIKALNEGLAVTLTARLAGLSAGTDYR